MRQHSSDLVTVLAAGGFLRWFEADLYYANERRLAAVPLTDVSIDYQGDDAVQGSMKASVAYTSPVAESILPREVGDVFAPFGAELNVTCVVSIGRREYKVSMGWFRLAGVPSALDQVSQFGQREITVGTVLELDLRDRFYGVDQNPFDSPQSAKILTSVYGEFARLTGLQITRSVPDGTIERSAVYEENRLDAAYALGEIIDAVPYMAEDGSASFRPKAWPAPVGTIADGVGGSLIAVKDGMSADGVYNRVVFRGETPDGKALYAVAEILTGPLRVRNTDGSSSPFGVRTKFLASEFVTRQSQAQEYANRELQRVGKLGTKVITITETFNPLREPGDVLWLQRGRKRETVRVRSVSVDSSGPTSLVAEVANA